MLLTVRDVAKRLNVSTSSVYALIQKGRLPHHRIGAGRGAIRVSEEDLAAYLESCRTQHETDGKPRKAPRPKLKHLRL